MCKGWWDNDWSALEGPRGREAERPVRTRRAGGAGPAGLGQCRPGPGPGRGRPPLTPYTRSSGQLTGIFNLGVNNKTDV